MQKQQVNVTETKLMGIQVRAHYQNELNPLTSEIGPCVHRYCQEGIEPTTPMDAVIDVYVGLSII